MVHSAEAAWKTGKEQQECRQPLSSSGLLKSGFESWQPAGLQAQPPARRQLLVPVYTAQSRAMLLV